MSRLWHGPAGVHVSPLDCYLYVLLVLLDKMSIMSSHALDLKLKANVVSIDSSVVCFLCLLQCKRKSLLM